MALAEAENNFSLQLKKQVNASVEEVFDAWTRADIVAQWLAPNREFKTKVYELDLKVGGRYRIEMTETDGSKHIVGGEYISITSPTQLVFTWAWEHSEDPAPTLVTIDLNAYQGKTELVLTHEKFPDAPIRDLHDEGWNGCLQGLDVLFG